MRKQNGPQGKRNQKQETTRIKRPSQRSQKAKAKKEQNKRHPVLMTFKILSFAVGSLVVLGVAGGAGYVSSMLKGLPKVSAASFANNRAASVVYDQKGKVIDRFKGDGDRLPISSVSQVSPHLVNSFIAAEDKTFYTNIGINPLSMGRAVFQDVLGHHIASGASTITQQTVKLAIFPEQQRTLHRKIQEIALALEVNHQLTKNEIMTDYMNWVYMGRLGNVPVYGVKRASEILFQKDPKNLTLPEAAFLAAIPNNPSYFSPYQFPQHTLDRQHYILQQMLNNKMIDQSQYDSAMKYDVLKDIHKPSTAGLPNYPYLMLDEIKPRVVQALVKAGLYDNATDAESALPNAGLKIYTTIDLSKQQDIDNVLHNTKLFKGTDVTYTDPNGKKKTDLYEAGVTLIDNQTGGILAIGGGRDFVKDNYDHADYARQPGSSIKPLLDYGPAFDQKILTAGSILYDAPTKFDTPQGVWEPHDAESVFGGLMSARKALYESRNVPAIDILSDITPQVGFSYLNKMGMGTDATTLNGSPTIVKADESHLSSAIGGLDHGVTVEQETSAYTTFPNQGVWHQSYLISHIDDETGRQVYTAHPKTEQVFSPQTAYIVTNILHDVVTNPLGTAPMLGQRFPGQYISGKTGTTDSQKDGWFIGYTQKYTMGIWMGYNNHERIASRNYNLKFTLWGDMMAPILKQDPAKTPWPKPNGIVNVDVSSLSGQLPTPLSTAHGQVVSEPYIDGTQPTQQDSVDVEAKYVVINGKKYLATTNTPPQDVKTGVFIKLPNVPDESHKVPNGVTADTPYLLPTQTDPRGGQTLEGGVVGGSQTQLSAPSGVKGTLAGQSVEITWDSVPSATKYEVYRASDPNGPWTDLGSTSTPAYTDNSLPQDTLTAYYEIFAESNNAMSDGSIPYGIAILPSPSGSANGNSTDNTSNGTGNDTTSPSNTTSPPPSNQTGGRNSTDGSAENSTTMNTTATNSTTNKTTNNTTSNAMSTPKRTGTVKSKPKKTQQPSL